MKEEIIKNLKQIEKENNVKILFAIESGSRLWRMASADSDYDVRFVFKRPLQDYLKIKDKSNVIDKMDKDFDLDFVGFDIYKFTKLILNSNPSVIEWVLSDLVYLDDGQTQKTFRDFIMENYNPISLYHHYKSMCKQNYLKYIKSREVMTYKKYLYSMRGLINAKWVINMKSMILIKFTESLKNIEGVPDEIIAKLKEIIELKKDGEEKNEVSEIRVLENYIESFLKQDDGIEAKRIENYQEIENYVIELVKKI